MNTMQEIIDRLPDEWHCVRCERDFPFLPDHPFPFGSEIKTDPKTGRRYHGGSICQECFNGARKVPA